MKISGTAHVFLGSEANIGLAGSPGPTREVHFEKEHAIGWLDQLKLDVKWHASAGRLDSREVLKQLPLDLADKGHENRP